VRVNVTLSLAIPTIADSNRKQIKHGNEYKK
jgi:hypothetical protein